MTKTELDVIKTLLGNRNGPFRTSPGPYRDIVGGRGHKVCQMLEAEGIGTIGYVSGGNAFVFHTHAMSRED